MREDPLKQKPYAPILGLQKWWGTPEKRKKVLLEKIAHFSKEVIRYLCIHTFINMF